MSLSIVCSSPCMLSVTLVDPLLRAFEVDLAFGPLCPRFTPNFEGRMYRQSVIVSLTAAILHRISRKPRTKNQTGLLDLQGIVV